MDKYLLIGFGGALGAIARYFVSSLVNYYVYLGIQFPWGTFIVNVSGCLVIGFVYGLGQRISLNSNWYFAFSTGFIGAYTTFSTFEYELFRLTEKGNLLVAMSYVLASILIGFIAVFIGIYIIRYLPTFN